MRKVFISPHNDDEVLFGAFTIMRHREDIEVVVVYDSYVQVTRGNPRCTAKQRRAETIEALTSMGVKLFPQFLGLRDDVPADHIDVLNAIAQFEGCHLWGPAFENGGNRHHNVVALALSDMAKLPGTTVTKYLTYTSAGKSTYGQLVAPNHWSDIASKLIALSCYHSQIEVPDCRPHFLRSQEEYLA